VNPDNTFTLAVDRRSAGYTALLKLADSIRSGAQQLPPKVYHFRSTPKSYRLITEKAAFSVNGDHLNVLNLPPIRLLNHPGMRLKMVASLAISRHAGGLHLRLQFLESKNRGYILTNCQTKDDTRLPPGIHNKAALWVTKRVKPKTVSGGLPSLGKRK
jgi:hypothetical protein